MAREPREKTAERLGANVKYLREAAPVSQAELARRMTERGWPWHQSTVYRVESGRQPMRFEEAVDLADILGVTLDRLTWATGEVGERERVDDAHNRLRDSVVDAVEAIAQFHAARAGAGQVAREAATSHYAHVRKAAGLIDEELRHATVRNVLFAAQDRWMEQGGKLDSADAALVGVGSDYSRRGNAIRAAAALYGQAVLTDVDPQFLSRLTEGMDPGSVDEVIAAVAGAAGERGDSMVLRNIRGVGLQRLATERLAAELSSLVRGPSNRELNAFLDQHKDSIGVSGRHQAITYIDRGGDMAGLASLFTAKFTPQELAELVRPRPLEAAPGAEVSSPTVVQAKVRTEEG